MRKLWTGFLHTNVNVDLGVVGHIIATPRFHHAHHDADRARCHANYAGLFPWIDRLFGTYTAGLGVPARGSLEGAHLNFRAGVSVVGARNCLWSVRRPREGASIESCAVSRVTLRAG